MAVGVSTGVLIDIGESGFSVTPVFEGCPVASGARWEAVGGAAVTAFMDTMLHSRSNEEFNKMVRLQCDVTVDRFKLVFILIVLNMFCR